MAHRIGLRQQIAVQVVAIEELRSRPGSAARDRLGDLNPAIELVVREGGDTSERVSRRAQVADRVITDPIHAAGGIGAGRSSVQGVVAVCGHPTQSVLNGDNVAHGVVARRAALTERVAAAHAPVQAVVAVAGDVIERVGDADQIAAGVVGETCHRRRLGRAGIGRGIGS